MLDLDELCKILQCCEGGDDDGNDDADSSNYVAIVLFIVSEVLPFIGVNANGIIHFLINLVKK